MDFGVVLQTNPPASRVVMKPSEAAMATSGASARAKSPSTSFAS